MRNLRAVQRLAAAKQIGAIVQPLGHCCVSLFSGQILAAVGRFRCVFKLIVFGLSCSKCTKSVRIFAAKTNRALRQRECFFAVAQIGVDSGGEDPREIIRRDRIICIKR